VSPLATTRTLKITSSLDEERTVRRSDIAFATSTLFNTLAAITVAMLVGLYVWLW
jgi:SSS family solute:Na+ symporter